MNIPASRNTYRPDIDGIRSIAVLSVLFFHLDISVFSGGFIGVDIFFVISGFLITRIIVSEYLSTGKFSFSNFYLRRVRRLFPAFLTVLLLTTLACLALLSPSDLQRYGATLFHSIFSLSNIYFWSEAGYFDTNSKLNPLLHTWSLSVEEQFYMIWPALAGFLFVKGGKSAVFKAIIVLVILSFALNLLFDQKLVQSIWPETTNDSLEKIRSAMFYLTPFRIFELGIGAMLVFIMDKSPSDNKTREVLFLVGLIMVLVPIFYFTEEIIFPSYNALLPCVGTALIIYAKNPKYFGLILRNPAAVSVGLISYSLYLVHWPVIVLYKYWLLRELEWTEQISIAAVSVIISVLIYKFIEQPYRHPIKNEKIELPNARFVTFTAIISASFLIAGSNMWGTQGWLWRLDEKRQEILSQISNPSLFHKNYYGGVNCEPNEHCIVNKDNGANIYFIGDSHSQQYAFGLASVFKQHQFTHIDNRCRFNTLNHCYAGKFQNSNFFDEKKKTLLELKNSNDMIIIGQSWGNLRPYFNEKQKTIIKFDDNREYIKFLVSELVSLNKYFGGNRIIVTGQVNRFGKFSDPLNCLSRPFGNSQCAFSEPTYAVEFNRLLGKQLKKANIPFLNPTRTLCKKNLGCANFNKAGMPLYSDAGHLSTWGSLLVVNRLKKQITQILKNSN